MAYATENPLDAMRQVISNFNAAHDLDCLSRTTDSLSFTHESQQMRLAQQVALSHKLARRLEDYRRRCADEREGHDPSAHHELVDALEADKWRTAKLASKLETESERLAGECKGLRYRLEEMANEHGSPAAAAAAAVFAADGSDGGDDQTV